MVSTRGLRYKFSEGERVLCYEPDPTKAKVLYDSKVLEVIESKDKRGRRTVEYLIHFQGWNSSWDRCVSEDFVLKDTEENRQLQRDLAEKSQLQLGAYLYRRERKKGSSASTGGGPAKRGRPGFSDDGSSSSTQPDEGDVCEGGDRGSREVGDRGEGEATGRAGDTDSSSGSRGDSAPRSPPPAHCGRAHVALPSALRDRLTFDYHLVVKRGRLSRLPASPSAAQILESFVKWFARAGAWNPARKHDPPHHHKPDMLDVSCRLNLVREIADGLRVYFDFTLRSHLLYKQEHAQYHDMCGMYIDESQNVKSEPEDEGCQSQDDAAIESLEEDLKSPKIPEYSHLPPDPSPRDNGQGIHYIFQKKKKPEDKRCQSLQENLKSPKIPEYPHLPPAPSPGDNGQETADRAQETTYEKTKHRDEEKHDYNGRTANTQEKVDIKIEIKSEPHNEEGSDGKSETEMDAKLDDVKIEKSDSPEECSHYMETEKVGKVRTRSRSGNVARRLRSHKSGVSQSEGEEPAPGPSEHRVSEHHSSSACSSGGSSLSEGWRAPPPPAPAPAPPGRTPLSLLLDKVSKWQIIPREESTEQLPCRVYGAIHLARLFVKLPDFLNTAQMPDFKLKLILKHIDMFIQYLDEHSEWFGEMYYIADSVSRSH